MKTFKEHNLFKWREVRLGDVARIRRGASPRPIDNPRWFAESGPGWVRISDVTRSNGRLRVTEQYLSQDGIDRSVRVGRGDVIMSICATIGEPVIIEMDACIHDGFVVFDQFENLLDRHFLLHLLRKIAPEFKASGQTGTQANLNTGIVNGKVVAIPSEVFEQSRIAAVLDTVDEAIAKTEAVIAKLKQVRASLLHDLLTRGLDENGQLRDPIAHPEQFQDSPIGRIPRGWEAGNVSSIAINRDARRVPLKQADRDMRHGIYPYYGASGIIDWIDNYLFDGEFVLIGEDGENLRSRHLPLAFVATGKFWVNNHAHILEPIQGGDFRFLAIILEAQDYIPWLLGSAQPKLTQRNLEQVPLKIPPPYEQSMIADTISDLDEQIAIEIMALHKQTQLKSALMADLLTGRVRVPASL